MNSRRPRAALRPPAALRNIVERALAGNADSVELEPVQDGLEVFWRAGNAGVGTMISDSEGNRIIRFIVRAAGLERHNPGKLTLEVGGERCKVSVAMYEHFGEWAYRLRFVPAKKRRRK